MAALTLDALQVELNNFARVALRRELAKLKRDIMLELQRWPDDPMPDDPMMKVGTLESDYRESEMVDERQSRLVFPVTSATEESFAKEETHDSRGNNPYTRLLSVDEVSVEPDARMFPINNEEDKRTHWRLADTTSTQSLASAGCKEKASRTCSWFLKHTHFTRCVIAVIVLNTAMFVAQTDYLARNWTTHPPKIFRIAESICLVIFILEICIRISVHRCDFFLDRAHLHHNLFDLFLVILQSAEAALCFMHSSGNSFVGALRILRVARILRVGRILYLVPAFRMLFVSIVASLGSLMWIMLLVLLTSGSFGVVLTQIVTDHKIITGREEIERNQKMLEEYFGSVPKTTMKLYQSITDGFHWAELADPLMDFVTPWSGLILVVYSSFVVFALMNIVTAFFVETAMEEAQADYQAHMSKTLWETFHKADIDPEREISEEEFVSHFDHPAMSAYFKKLGLDATKAADMRFFNLIDLDHNGLLTGNELMWGCLKLMGNARSIDLIALTREVRLEIRSNQEYRKVTAQTLDQLRNQVISNTKRISEKRLPG